MIKKATIVIMAIFVMFVSFSLVAQEKKPEQKAPAQEQAAPAEQPQQTAPVQQQQAAPAEQKQTPAAGATKVEKHWSKYVYPEDLPADAKIHIIEKGDCLWNLAGKYLTNSFLWPQIWEANKYITNAHWIYPGDPLIIPAPAQVPAEKVAEGTVPPAEAGTEAVAEEKAAEEEVSQEPEFLARMTRPKPLISKGDVLCSSYILNSFGKYKYRIVASEQEVYAVSYSTNDIVYIDGGQGEGITAGSKFLVLHPDLGVEDPVTYKSIGTLVRKAGVLTVIATQEHTSTAQFTQSCFPSSIGDYLVPFEEPKVPIVTKAPKIDKYAPFTSKLRGRIIYSDTMSNGADHIVYIDRGSKDGVEVGARFLIYRNYKKSYEEEKIKTALPDTILGQLIVFETQDNISVGKIITSFDFIRIGESVALM